MRKRKLGKTGLEVSELGFGCWAIGGASYGPTEDRESLKALAYGFDQNINFFDTADTYGNGHSEQLIGETFKESSKRLQVVIATKVGWDFYRGWGKRNFNPDYIRFACGESLKRLRTDYIDLYQLHNPRMEEIEEGSMFKMLSELKREGKIRHWGVSIHGVGEGVEVIQKGTETIQAIYNMIDQRIKPELIPLCGEHDIGLIAREPLYCGLLTDKYHHKTKFRKDDHRNRWTREKLETDFKKIERIKMILFGTRYVTGQVPRKNGIEPVPALPADRPAVPGTVINLKQAAIEFVLYEQAVSVVIPGMKTVSHVQDHLKAVETPSLTSDEVNRIHRLFQEDELFQTVFYRN
ncbi:MAG: aldo/keto reductase [Candidatus Omnitrophica bacterium]|nr:aldo/keto reductase [Candidatus Omnitrophota bacterium]